MENKQIAELAEKAITYILDTDNKLGICEILANDEGVDEFMEIVRYTAKEMHLYCPMPDPYNPFDSGYWFYGNGLERYKATWEEWYKDRLEVLNIIYIRYGKEN